MLNLFIGEDLTVQEKAHAAGEICQHAPHTATDADAKKACNSTNHHGPGKVTQNGGAPLTRTTVYIERITPHVTQHQPLRVSSPEQKHAVYGRLTRRLYINEQANNLMTAHWLRIPEPFAIQGRDMARRIAAQCREAGAREIAAILRR